MNSLDTDWILSCQLCRENIPALDNKIVVGTHLGPYKRILIFHPACWRVWQPRWDKALKWMDLGKESKNERAYD